jgi:hypothetical protein
MDQIVNKSRTQLVRAKSSQKKVSKCDLWWIGENAELHYYD